MKMLKIWEDVKEIGVEVVSDRVIYKGIIFQIDGGDLAILSGQTEFYDPLPEEDLEVFTEQGLAAGVKNFLTKKYTKLILKSNRLIKLELESRRNQKRIKYLKQMRLTYVEQIAKL